MRRMQPLEELSKLLTLYFLRNNLSLHAIEGSWIQLIESLVQEYKKNSYEHF